MIAAELSALPAVRKDEVSDILEIKLTQFAGRLFVKCEENEKLENKK